MKVIAEFARVTNVSANNFFLKLDALTPKLLGFFQDKSTANKQLKQELDTFSKMVGIIYVQISVVSGKLICVCHFHLLVLVFSFLL